MRQFVFASQNNSVSKLSNYLHGADLIEKSSQFCVYKNTMCSNKTSSNCTSHETLFSNLNLVSISMEAFEEDYGGSTVIHTDHSV